MGDTRKVALVTGSSGGIGRMIALRFAKEGFDVIAHFNSNRTAAQTLVDELRTFAPEAVCLKADIGKGQEVEDMVRASLHQFGSIDVLVNSAGWEKVHYFVEGHDETWRKIVDANFWGPLVVSRAVLRNMIKKKSGCIVNIASDAGRGGVSGGVVYSGCKAGIIGITKSLAREMARYNIRVNCVSPGVITTPMKAASEAAAPGRMEKVLGAIPMGRAGQPEEIADAVLFLASDKASYITGQTLSVSGGLTMM